MIYVLRVLALIGSLAHGVDRLVARLLGFLPFRVPGALMVALLLAAASWGSVQDTNEAIAARPRPVPTTVSALVERGSSAWVSISGVLSGPHLDNSIYASDRRTHFLRISDDPHDHVVEAGGEQILFPGRRETIFSLTQGDGVTRWFYVLRELDGGDAALVVRSARDRDQMRTRSVAAISVGAIDGLPHLVEVEDAGADAAGGLVSEASDDEPMTIRGAFTDATEIACDGGEVCRDGSTWRYRVTDSADSSRSAWIDSPHPPDELPLTLEGVVTTDASRMAIVLATNEMEAALDGLRHPDDLVLADGVGPVIPEATYFGAAVFGISAGILLLSAAVRYPVFRRDRRNPRRDLPRPVIDELVPVEVGGELPGASGTERLSGAPARVGWLPARELARRAWHLRSALPQSQDELPRLALLAVEGGFVLPIEPLREHLTVESGLVATGAAVRPALRLRGPQIRVTLGFRSSDDRDRIRRELEPATSAAEAGPIPNPVRPSGATRRPWARPATAASLAVTGLAVAGSALIDMLTGDGAPAGLATAVVAAVALGLLALGVARGHSLADELLPSVALLGLVVAAVVAVASFGCGTWLTPNLAGCGGFNPVRLVAPVAGFATFAMSLWAMPHLSKNRAP